MLNQDVEMYEEVESAEETAARKLAEQDVSIETGIGKAELLIETVSNDPGIMAILSEMGYDEAAMEEGRALLDKARLGFSARAAAIANQRFASSRLNGSQAVAVKAFTDFRMVARAVFKTDPEASSALNLKDSLPHNRSQFIAKARTAIHNAFMEPYAGELARFGYTEEGLKQVEAAVTELASSDAMQNQLISDAMTATAGRNTAWEQLNSWVIKFRTIAKTALRDQPDLVKILDV
jgi:hypothetical protein